MKVLLINNFFYRKGGSESVFFNTANLLRDAGHEIIFFSYEDENNIHTKDHEYFVKRGGPLTKVRDYFYNPIAAKKLDFLLSMETPDVAHAHLFWGGLSPSIIKVLQKRHIPLVHTAHDYRMVCPAYLLTDGKGRFCERCKGNKFYQCTINRCSKGSFIESLLMSVEMYYRNLKWHPVKCIDGFVFVSNFSKQKHIGFDKRFEKTNNIVLYNCPSREIKESFDLNKDTFNSFFLFYGRLSDEKGVSTLIRSFECYPQLKLKIVGAGPAESKLKAFCNKNGMDNVAFLGYKTGKELFDLVATAKYVCVPSECYENNPMTIVESYSLGTPVIGADIGGISEIVKDGETGYTFESGSIDSLRKALDKAVALNKDQYVIQKQNAYRFGEDNFSRTNYLERLIKFYEEIINKKKKKY